MISTDFAPNESFGDAWQSIKQLFLPWAWQSGKKITRLKRKIQSFFPGSNVFLFLSGRAALYLLLKSLNLKKNDEVVLQAFTCEAVVLPILANRLRPQYVDIETQTFSMDYESLLKKINTKTKVLILQHTFGLTPLNRQKILGYAKAHNLFVIEDMAHGFPSNGTASNAADAILLSFGRSKSISSVFGGAIVTQNQKLASDLDTSVKNLNPPSFFFIFRTLLYKPLTVFIKSTYDIYLGKILHKIIMKLNLLIPEITNKEKSGQYDFLLSKSFPNALASLLLYQLTKFEQTQKNRSTVCDIYQKKLKNVPSSKFQALSSLLRYPLLVNNRDGVIKRAGQKNIFLGQWYNQVVAPKSLSLDRVGYRQGSCPTAEKICQQIINLPTNISVKEAERVVKILNDV